VEVFELLRQIKEANSDIGSAASQKLLEHILELFLQANESVAQALSVSTDSFKPKEGIQHDAEVAIPW
jgi:RNase adaptor protein for sRNA GlmZ degradation